MNKCKKERVVVTALIGNSTDKVYPGPSQQWRLSPFLREQEKGREAENDEERQKCIGAQDKAREEPPHSLMIFWSPALVPRETTLSSLTI